MDNRTVSKTRDHTLGDGGESYLDFSTNLNRGSHILEAYGGSEEENVNTNWEFRVNGGEWKPMTNLNLYWLCPVTVLPETASCASGMHIMTNNPIGASGDLHIN